MEEKLKARLTELLKKSGVKASVVIKAAASGFEFRANDTERVKAASLIKLPVLWNLFERAERGELDLNETVTIDENRKVDGGLLHRTLGKPTLRLCDCALLAAAVSDNTAANILIDRLGFDAINATAQQLGMSATSCGRKMLDAEARKAGKDNFTSAGDVAQFFISLLDENKLSGSGRKAILSFLSAQKLQSKLAGQLPCDDVDDLELVLAHKTGELPGCEHDAGIFFPLGANPVVVVVMTFEAANRLDGVKLCSEIGRLVYDTYKDCQ